MSLSFGWENYLSPHQRSAPSDFEVHRAQMRHYDAWTSEHGRPGSLGAADRARAAASGSSGSSSSGGSSSGAQTGAVASSPKASGGHLVVSGPDAGVSGPGVYVDPEWGNHSPALESENTVIRMGSLTMVPHPGFTDVETGAEQRYGDFGAIPFALVNMGADLNYNRAALAKWANEGLDGLRFDAAGAAVDFVDYLESRRPEKPEPPVQQATWAQKIDNAMANAFGQSRPFYHGF